MGAPGEPGANSRIDAMIIFPGHTREEVLAAVRGRGGRVLMVFDSPAAIVRLEPDRLESLSEALPGLRVAVGPIDDQDALALAPGPLGYWNRRFGVAGSPGPAVSASTFPPARGPRPAEPILGPSVQLDETLDREARVALLAFMECLAGGGGPCLDRILDPDAPAAVRTLCAREAERASANGWSAAGFTFALQRYDGARARYELRRDGHPTGTVTVRRRNAAWTVEHIDP